MRDYYEVLQVHPRAESDVIRAAYRVLARKYHPDHGGDRARMIAINDAWDILGDPARRAAYDAAWAAAGRTSGEDGGPASTTVSPATQRGDPRSPAAPPSARSGEAAGGRPGPPWGSQANDESGVSNAGPPPGNRSGTVLDFGRYRGWSVGEIARQDLDYIEWLQRATIGRPLKAELEALLRGRRGAGVRGRGATGRR
jgi:curved DNA-binding protein CbpA